MLQEREVHCNFCNTDSKHSAKQFLLDLTAVAEEVASPPVLFPHHPTATVKSDQLVTQSPQPPQLTHCLINK